MRAKGAGRGEEATEKLGTVGDLGAVGTTVLSGMSSASWWSEQQPI